MFIQKGSVANTDDLTPGVHFLYSTLLKKNSIYEIFIIGRKRFLPKSAFLSPSSYPWRYSIWQNHPLRPHSFKTKDSPLSKACKLYYVDIVKILLNHPKIDPTYNVFFLLISLLS